MKTLRRPRFMSFEGALVCALLLIGVMGILTLYSATHSGGSGGGMPLYQKQLVWWGLGLATMITLILIDYRHLEHYGYLIYGGSVLLLGYVLFFGRVIAGSRRWIELGPFQFQPSELMKLTLIIALAKYFHHHQKERPYRLTEIFSPFLLFLVPFVLVLRQPDLGTAIMLMLLFFSLVLFQGLTRGSIYTLLCMGSASLPLGWFSLKDYQKDRVLTFLDPSKDPLGRGYHIIQSKIATGSGGFWGKGFLHGTQTRLDFLPEQHTDFIFSAFAEQWGFLGGTLLLGGYLLILVWALNMASKAKNRFGMLLSLGITFLLFWHVVINIAMCLGLMPIVGIPLPLFSYGGSFLLVTFMGIGLLLNVYFRRFVF